MLMTEERPTSTNLLTLRAVKDYLGVSYGVVLGQIRQGKLKAIKVTGDPVRREEINGNTFGLRIRPEDLDEYLERQAVR